MAEPGKHSSMETSRAYLTPETNITIAKPGGSVPLMPKSSIRYDSLQFHLHPIFLTYLPINVLTITFLHFSRFYRYLFKHISSQNLRVHSISHPLQPQVSPLQVLRFHHPNTTRPKFPRCVIGHILFHLRFRTFLHKYLRPPLKTCKL
jgi:hypothetical protein